MKRLNQFFVAIALIGAFSSCQKEDSSSTSLQEQQASSSENNSSESAKSIQLSSTPDYESEDYSDASFELKEVDAYIENQGWITLNSESQLISMGKIQNGASIEIAQIHDIGLSSIKKLKLIFGDENYIIGDGLLASSSSIMSFSSSHEAIVDISQETSSDSQLYLSIDLDQSIVKSGLSYVFNPTIEFIKDFKTGLKGSVEGAAQAMVTVRNASLAYQTFLSSTGEFMIRDMEEGVYTVVIDPINDGLSSKEISGVFIVEGKITSTQNIQF